MKRHGHMDAYPPLGSAFDSGIVKKARTGPGAGHAQSTNYAQLYNEYGTTTKTTTRTTHAGGNNGSNPRNATGIGFAPFWRTSVSGRFQKPGGSRDTSRTTTTTTTVAKPGSVYDIARKTGYPLLDTFNRSIRTNEPFSTASTAGIIASKLIDTQSFKKHREKDYRSMPKGTIVVCTPGKSKSKSTSCAILAASPSSTDQNRFPLILAESTAISDVPGKLTTFVAAVLGDAAELQTLLWCGDAKEAKAGAMMTVFVDANDNTKPKATLKSKFTPKVGEKQLFNCRLILTPVIRGGPTKSVHILVSPYVIVQCIHLV